MMIGWNLGKKRIVGMSGLLFGLLLVSVSADETITGTKTITSSGDLSGKITLDGGTLATSTGGITLSNNFVVNPTGGTVQVAGSSVVLGISGIISDGSATYGTLTKTGDGTLKLSGINTFQGLYRVNGGTLELAATRNILSSTGKMGSFEINNNALLNLTMQNALDGGTDSPDMVTLNGSRMTTNTTAFSNVGPITLNNGTILSEGLPTNANVANYSFDARITATGSSTISAARIAFRNEYGDGNSGKINVVNAADTLNISSELHFIDTRTVEKEGAGTLIFSGKDSTNNNNNFFLKVTGGTLQLGDGTSASIYDWSRCVHLTKISFAENTAAKALVVAQAVDSEFTQTIAAAYEGITLSNTVAGTTATFTKLTGATGVTLTKAGAGTVKLTSTTPFAGNLQVNAGSLSLATLPASGTALTLNGGTLDFNLSAAATLGTHAVALGDGGAISVTGTKALTIDNATTLTGNLVKTGTGTLIFSNTNFTGAMTVNEGRLELNTARTVSGNAKWGNFTVNEGAELYLSVGNALGVLSAPVSLPNRVTVNGGTINNGVNTHSNLPILFLNDGTVTAPASYNGTGLGSYCFAGPVIATGNSEINAAVVSVRNDSFIVSYGNETSGTFNVSGVDSTLNLSSTIINYNGLRTTLTKSGDGTLNFTGGVNYGFAFDVNDGTLNLAMATTKGNSKLANVNVKNGAELAITAASQNITDTLTMNDGSTLSFYLDPDAATTHLTVGNLLFDEDATLAFDLSDDFLGKITPSTQFHFLSVTGNNGLSYEDFAAFVNATPGLGSYFIPSLVDGNFGLSANGAAIPEPASWILLLLGWGFLLRRRR